MVKLALTIFCIICLSYFQSSSDKQLQVVEANIAEIVFRHRIQSCYAELRQKSFYLEMKDKKLSREFIERFDSERFTVRNHSQADAKKDKRIGITPIFLYIRSISFRNDIEAEVLMNCVIGLSTGEEYSYSLIRRNGTWMIKDFRRTGIL